MATLERHQQSAVHLLWHHQLWAKRYQQALPRPQALRALQALRLRTELGRPNSGWAGTFFGRPSRCRLRAFARGVRSAAMCWAANPKGTILRLPGEGTEAEHCQEDAKHHEIGHGSGDFFWCHTAEGDCNVPGDKRALLQQFAH